MTQYGNLDLTGEELKRPFDIVKKVADTIDPDNTGGVRIFYIRKGYNLHHSEFGGILLKIHDINYRDICRSVKIKMITGEGRYRLDIDKVKEKYDELRKMRAEMKALQKERDERLAEDETLIKKIVQDFPLLKDKGIRITKDNSDLDITITHLTEEEIRKVMEFVKQIKSAPKVS